VRICKTNSLGKENGIKKSYYDNGQLEKEVNYIDGKDV
jgi:antitoxin component YwqK of YwqJK toxin-antitoxin module